jgi:hypothetical protein
MTLQVYTVAVTGDIHVRSPRIRMPCFRDNVRAAIMRPIRINLVRVSVREGRNTDIFRGSQGGISASSALTVAQKTRTTLGRAVEFSILSSAVDGGAGTAVRRPARPASARLTAAYGDKRASRALPLQMVGKRIGDKNGTCSGLTHGLVRLILLSQIHRHTGAGRCPRQPADQGSGLCICSAFPLVTTFGRFRRNAQMAPEGEGKTGREDRLFGAWIIRAVPSS